MTRLTRLLGAATVVFCLASDAAVAGVVSHSDGRGDVKTPGLKSTERNAIDVVGVDVVSEPDLGLLVTVTFRGHFQRRVGHGGLARAMATVIVNQKTSGPAVLSTDSGGLLGHTVREQTIHPLEVVRKDRTVTFMVMGATADDATGVQVKTFARRPYYVTGVLAAKGTDRTATIPLTATALACPQAQLGLAWATSELQLLRARRVSIQQDIDMTAAAIANRSIPFDLRARLRFQLADLFGTSAGAPRDRDSKAKALRTLRVTRDRLIVARTDLTSRILVLNDLVQSNLRVIVAGRCGPNGGPVPAPGNPPDAPTISPVVATLWDDASLTTYAVTAMSPGGGELSYDWSLVPDANQRLCTTFDKGVPDPNRAMWHHLGTSQGCNPEAALGPEGYGGTVTVVVSDGVYNCVATYRGTNTGIGPAPAACTHL